MCILEEIEHRKVAFSMEQFTAITIQEQVAEYKKSA
jgi:hypothetical protein